MSADAAVHCRSSIVARRVIEPILELRPRTVKEVRSVDVLLDQQRNTAGYKTKLTESDNTLSGGLSLLYNYYTPLNALSIRKQENSTVDALSAVGRRAFLVAGACIWNDFPSDITTSPSVRLCMLTF